MNITREIRHRRGEKSIHVIVSGFRSGNIGANEDPKGLDEIEISGREYLVDLRTFRDEMKQRRAYWRQKLLRKKLVLSSDPDAGHPNVRISSSSLWRECG